MLVGGDVVIAWLRRAGLLTQRPRRRTLDADEVRGLYDAGLTLEQAVRLLALRWRVQAGVVRR